ncbi:hypothetical protein B7486_56605 [cyanobacterium TDX16]|nr:hypothetical protein B7486_56605 [cyanobacterium TDX16]
MVVLRGVLGTRTGRALSTFVLGFILMFVARLLWFSEPSLAFSLSSAGFWAAGFTAFGLAWDWASTRWDLGDRGPQPPSRDRW